MSIEGRNEWVHELLRDNNLVYEDDKACRVIFRRSKLFD